MTFPPYIFADCLRKKNEAEWRCQANGIPNFNMDIIGHFLPRNNPENST